MHAFLRCHNLCQQLLMCDFLEKEMKWLFFLNNYDREHYSSTLRDIYSMKTDRNIQCNRGYLVSPDTVLVFVIISLKKKN